MYLCFFFGICICILVAEKDTLWSRVTSLYPDTIVLRTLIGRWIILMKVRPLFSLVQIIFVLSPRFCSKTRNLWFGSLDLSEVDDLQMPKLGKDSRSRANKLETRDHTSNFSLLSFLESISCKNEGGSCASFFSNWNVWRKYKNICLDCLEMTILNDTLNRFICR